ncbi:WW domain-binding protein 4-like [Glandiceps talaboti]
MAEYWKSQPKKFCDFCKCWIADNKASVDFHERGKRHKENVQKKIADIQKKGIQKMKADENFKRDLEAMEKAALEAFQKDVANDPSLAKQYQTAVTQKKLKDAQEPKDKVSEQHNVSNVQNNSENVTNVQNNAENVTNVQNNAENVLASWMECISPEGYLYYWNSVTNDTQWEKPEGFIPSSENQETNQAEASSTTNTEETKNDEPTSEANEESQDTKTNSNQTLEEEKVTKESTEEEKEDEKTNQEVTVTGKKRTNPYGQWQAVEPVETTDLQLPEARQFFTAPIVSTTQEPKVRLKFKEKTVGSLAGSNDSTNVGFKKRKFGNRNIKKREEES